MGKFINLQLEYFDNINLLPKINKELNKELIKIENNNLLINIIK